MKMKRLLTMVCALVLAFSLSSCTSMGPGEPVDSIEDSWQGEYAKVDYDTLAHNASNMKGQRVKITGKIFQVVELPFSKAYMFDMRNPYDYNNTNYMQHVYVTDSKKSNLIVNDEVTIYGVVKGTQTYTTVLGAQRTIPKIEAERITNEKYMQPAPPTLLPDGTWAVYDPETDTITYYPTYPY